MTAYTEDFLRQLGALYSTSPHRTISRLKECNQIPEEPLSAIKEIEKQIQEYNIQILVQGMGIYHPKFL
jgi:hypothetical protein